MKAKLQYNLNYPNYPPIWADITESELLFVGEGGNSNMSLEKRNIPFVYKNNLSPELQIKFSSIYKNIYKNLSNFDVTTLYDTYINSNLLYAPLRIIVIPYKTGIFDLAPRLILRELLDTKIAYIGTNYIDVTNDSDNSDFLRLTKTGDIIIVNKNKYIVSNIYNISNGKRFYFNDNNIPTIVSKVYNLSRFKDSKYNYTLVDANKYKSILKILYIKDVTSEIEQDLTKYDDNTAFLFNSDNAWKLKNFIPNVPYQLDEYQDNIFNDVISLSLSTSVSKTSSHIVVLDSNKINSGDVLLVDFTSDGTVYNIEMTVNYKDGNIIYVDQDHSVDIPVNANIYRNIEYLFYIFIYPEDGYIFNKYNIFKLKFEYI